MPVIGQPLGSIDFLTLEHQILDRHLAFWNARCIDRVKRSRLEVHTFKVRQTDMGCGLHHRRCGSPRGPCRSHETRLLGPERRFQGMPLTRTSFSLRLFAPLKSLSRSYQGHISGCIAWWESAPLWRLSNVHQNSGMNAILHVTVRASWPAGTWKWANTTGCLRLDSG